MLGLAVASIVLLAFFLYNLGGFNNPPNTVGSSASTKSYPAAASSVVSSLAGNAPPGYAQGASKELSPDEPGIVSGAFSLFSNQAGALANVTILVFDGQGSAQRYVDSVISNAKALSGYSNSNSTLTAYQAYGTCYGYAESDPGGGGAVANGVCTKGNVYIQVHLASVASLPSAEGDVSSFVGAAYGALD